MFWTLSERSGNACVDLVYQAGWSNHSTTLVMPEKDEDFRNLEMNMGRLYYEQEIFSFTEFAMKPCIRPVL